MSLTTRPGLRWVVPAGVTTLVLGAAVAGPALSAAADVELPERTAAQLLTDLQTADVDAFSGTVAHSADLGLPALPEGMGGGHHSTDLASLLDGEHELRVWASGHQGRVALKGELGELGVVSDGSDVWTWSSDDNTATHLVLPEHDGDTHDGDTHDGDTHDGDSHDGDDRWEHSLPPVTPEQVTDYLLRSLDPSTAVTTGPNDTVAGHAAYELVLEPRGEGSLVGAVRIAVDAERHVPTRVQVFAAGSTAPALEVAFTTLSFETPDDDLFRFTPPAGATVEEHVLDGHGGGVAGAWPGGHPAVPGAGTDPGTDGDRVAVVGEGWSAVGVARVADGAGASSVDALGDDAGAFLAALPRVSGEWGSGRLLTSRLFSALLTDDGRLLVGSVDGDRLVAAAGDPAAALG